MSEQKPLRDPKKVNLANAIISLLGLAVTFAIAYGFDRWSDLLRRQASANFAWTSYYWFLSISNLIFAGLMLVLAWFVCFRANKTRLIPLLYLLIGLLAAFAFAIEVTVSPTFQMITPGFLLPNSRVVHVSAFAAAIGAAGLVRSKFDHDRTKTRP
jgi:hypothetical protein